MNKAKHTPTPWASDDYVIYSLNGEHIAHTDNTMRSPDEDDDNAAHIVKCVNMHDELVDKLENILIAIGMGWDLEGVTEEAANTLKKAGAL